MTKQKNKGKIISIIDYGVGNLYSLTKACRKFSDSVVVTDDPEVIKSSAALILPGVGSFGAGINGLKQRCLIGTVREFASSGKPILGICLGAQLLMSKGYEFGKFEGLGIISGEAAHFPKLVSGIKVPHIGWNQIEESEFGWTTTIFSGLPPKPHMYFVHSYILKPKNPADVFAVTNYGGLEFCSAVRRGNIYGCQFHPEKSAKDGLKIIKNFVENV